MNTILDIHSHIYPALIAGKAAKAIQDFYQHPVMMNGTAETLLAADKAAGITRSVVHSVAVSPSRVQHVNDFIMLQVKRHPGEFIGFGSLHPDMEGLEAELDRIQEGGLKGLKLHPDFQTCMVDDPAYIQIFREIAKRNLPVLLHVGDRNRPYSQPERVARVLDAVPNLRMICAHFGGWSIWREGWKILAGRDNVWVDSSSSLYALSPEEAADLIHQYGSRRVFFGTDYPMWDPLDELSRFNALPLTNEEREDILHRNLESFLGLETEDHG